MVSLLTLGFGLPIHEAVGTALASMMFVSISGTISHYRQGNVNVPAGIVVGLFGMIGAVTGAQIGQHIPEHILKPGAGIALWFLALLVWMRTRLASHVAVDLTATESPHTRRQVASGGTLGVVGGMASAFFGVGMTPFIQLGMLNIFRLSLVRTVGTTMLALIFISTSGSIALARHGDVSYKHLIGVTIGMTLGSFVGARYTNRAPVNVLRIAIVVTPFIAGCLLIFD